VGEVKAGLPELSLFRQNLLKRTQFIIQGPARRATDDSPGGLGGAPAEFSDHKCGKPKLEDLEAHFLDSLSRK
jgi:hypothetical protein